MCTGLRLRTEKEVLKLQQKVLVIQLNDALAQLQTLKEEQAPFNASQMVFFSSYRRSAKVY